jgi:hypothetical protein
MLNFIGVVFFAIMTLAGILAVIKPVTEDGKQVSRKRMSVLLGLFVIGLIYNGYWLTHDTPEEAAAKKARAEVAAKYDACWNEYGTTDKGRNTAVMVVEIEFMRMGKTYLLQGKDDSDKIRMFCDVKSKQK